MCPRCDALLQSCVLFQLLRLFVDCCVVEEDADGVEADKKSAQQLVVDQVLPLTQKLLRSFDPATAGRLQLCQAHRTAILPYNKLKDSQSSNG